LAIFIGVNWLFAAAVSLYVYLGFPHPSVVHYAGTTPRSESIEVYLFGFPGMLTFQFLAISYVAVFWKKLLPGMVASEARNQAQRPYLKGMDVVWVHHCAAAGMACGAMLLLGLSIYRSLLVVTNGL
jgi:hypothetical protein